MAVVYIGIGSNLGDPTKNCMDAVAEMERCGIRIVHRSTLIETDPWGVTDQPRFMNMAVEAETDLPPLDLLRLLKSIERRMGREQAERWGPRVIDLDILFYDELVISTEDLVIPHPHIADRRFVLEPLNEINPHLIHPLLKRDIGSLLLHLSSLG